MPISQIKDILTSDWDKENIETKENTWIDNLDLFKWKSLDFFTEAEFDYLKGMSISIETVDWNHIKCTAEDIMRSIYLKFSRDSFSFDKTEIIKLYDWKWWLIDCYIYPKSETIIRLECRLNAINWKNQKIDAQITENDLQNIYNDELDMPDFENSIKRAFLYTTKTNEVAYYNSPNLSYRYAIRATISPYQDLEIMKRQTKIPDSILQIDLFTNYINTVAIGDDWHVEDNIVWKKCFNRKKDKKIKNIETDWVDFTGDKFRNLNRFLLIPNFITFNIDKDQARLNIVYDLYKYYLFMLKWDREEAWNKSILIVKNRIDPILNDKFRWRTENNNLPSGYLYSDQKIHDFVVYALEHNRDIYLWKTDGNLITKEELINFVTNHLVSWFQKSTKYERKRTEWIIQRIMLEIEKNILLEENSKILKYRRKETWYPNEDMEYYEKEVYKENNPKQIKKIKVPLTEEELNNEIEYKNEELNKLKNLKF